ncbi:hypothetical protein C8Q80DRAFT_1266146 [Daedaleopsis nitida]|nr:hypothetical protein C8Q80DRAFT_1266146 [Daedaleopsis nitida]
MYGRTQDASSQPQDKEPEVEDLSSSSDDGSEDSSEEDSSEDEEEQKKREERRASAAPQLLAQYHALLDIIPGLKDNLKLLEDDQVATLASYATSPKRTSSMTAQLFSQNPMRIEELHDGGAPHPPLLARGVSLITGKRKPSLSQKYDIHKVTPRMLAYTAVLVWHSLTDKDWSVMDVHYNNAEFFDKIVDLFKEPLTPWAKACFSGGTSSSADDSHPMLHSNVEPPHSSNYGSSSLPSEDSGRNDSSACSNNDGGNSSARSRNKDLDNSSARNNNTATKSLAITCRPTTTTIATKSLAMPHCPVATRTVMKSLATTHRPPPQRPQRRASHRLVIPLQKGPMKSLATPRLHALATRTSTESTMALVAITAKTTSTP